MRAWIAIVTCVIAACGSSHDDRAPAPVPTKPPAKLEPRVVAIGRTAKLSPVLQRAFDPSWFEPMPEPQTGDWMAEHWEDAQTFDAYVRSKPNVPYAGRNTIYLLPLGEFPRGAPSIDALQKIVHAYFTLEVKQLPAVPLAKVEAKRRINAFTGKPQLLAPDVLKWLEQRVPDDAFAVMAVTMEDLYPEPSWNFVFGMASFEDRVGVQSFARQDPAFFGDARGAGWEKLALRRATWTVVHEISHMFGLHHCQYYKCVIAGSNSQDEADRAPLHACPVCLHKLQWALSQFGDVDLVARERALASTLAEVGIDDEAAWATRRVKWLETGAR